MAKRTVTVDVFPEGSEVSIKIDNDLYNRLVRMLVENAMSNTKEDLGTHLQNILDNETKSNYEEHMSTLLYIIALIEDEMRAQKLIIKKDIEIDDEEGTVNEAPEKPAES
jgi:hypothetical protein